MKCEYCGNTSGRTNYYGGCISCGAPMSDGTPRFIIRGDQEMISPHPGGVLNLNKGETFELITLQDGVKYYAQGDWEMFWRMAETGNTNILQFLNGLA